ncbi:MAG: nucleoside hydrolase [Chloroflexota bacterium]
MSRIFWIDTDMGSDDAVALIMALRADDVNVIGISTLSGNVPLKQAANNARFVAELCGSDVPVYAGADKPLLRPYVDATWFHGEDGLSGYAQMPHIPPQTQHAVDALIQAAETHPNLIIVTLGPLTNIALAIARAPHIIPNIARCIVMGGAAASYGNVTPSAEYNIWVDPEAARMVFLSGLPVEMVGWEFCYGDYALNDDEMAQIRAVDTPLAHFVVDCNQVAIEAYREQTGERGLSLPDGVAMAIALDQSIATHQEKHYVEVLLDSDFTRGMTLVDKLNVAEDTRNRHTWAQAIDAGKNVSVIWDVDVLRWKSLLFSLLN